MNKQINHLNSSNTRKVCLFGGTFNPPHIGHRMIVEKLLQLDFDEIIIMPCYQSPFKKATISVDNRIAMLKLFCELFASPKVQLSLYEINKSSITYTYETIKHFAKNDVDLYFALGADTLLDLDNWEGSDYIKQNVTFILAERQCFDTANNSKIICLNNELVAISSSDIRAGNRINCCKYLDKPIYDYIVQQNLYDWN